MITIGLIRIVASFALCAITVFLIRRLIRTSAEFDRKLLHFSVIVVLTAWLYAFDDWHLAEMSMAIFLVSVYAVLLVIERYSLFPFLFKLSSERKHGELRKSLCAAGFMFMLLVAVCWGWQGERSLALASIFAWGPGDAAAALIGKKYGKRKIGKEKKKSLEGTAAMFTLSFLCVLIILLASRSLPLPIAISLALVTGAVSAWVELVDGYGLDTFFCPAAAMTVLCLARLLFS